MQQQHRKQSVDHIPPGAQHPLNGPCSSIAVQHMHAQQLITPSALLLPTVRLDLVEEGSVLLLTVLLPVVLRAGSPMGSYPLDQQHQQEEDPLV